MLKGDLSIIERKEFDKTSLEKVSGTSPERLILIILNSQIYFSIRSNNLILYPCVKKYSGEYKNNIWDKGILMLQDHILILIIVL